jgi:2-polyprenyl-3-methyl-5-hydroxy-6-metoxy-1,4-benzoquinol methylase
MIIDETDPNKIKLLLDKINNNPTGISRLLADFTEIDIFSNSWPLAVDPLLISDGSIEDQTMRAETIVDVILPPLENKKFLDFGCGEGYVTKVAAKVAALAMGYDIKTKEDDFLTTSFEKVTKKPLQTFRICLHRWQI